MSKLFTLLLALIALTVVPSTTTAQTVAADRFRLNTGPCVERSGSGSPEGAVTGNVCDRWIRTDSVSGIYIKTSGTGNTGWSLVGLPPPAAKSVLYSGFGDAPVFEDEPELTSLTALTVTAGTVGSGGDLELNPTGKDVLPTNAYDFNLGAINRKWLTLHAAELWVQTLVAQDVMATIGGRVVVGPTTKLIANLPDSDTWIRVEHNELASGDRILLEGDGKVEWLAVTSSASVVTGGYQYDVTRDLDGSGANQWYAGDAVLNTGTTGNGYIDLYSVAGVLPGSTAGPTIVGNVRTGSTYSNIAPRWAIGNLNGLYGYSADTYGAAFGDASNAWLKVDPTNGVRIGHGSTTNLHLEADGDASFAGNITAAGGTIGGWTIGSTSLTASSGAVGLSSAVTGGDDIRFWAGHATPASAPFRVTEAGAVTMTSGSVSGSLIVDGSLSTTKLAVGSAGAALNDNPSMATITGWSTTTGTIGIATVTGPAGSNALYNSSATGAAITQPASRRITIDRTKTYRVRAWASRLSSGANGTLFLGVALQDAAGANITNPPGSGATYWYVAAQSVVPATTWTEYVGYIGPSAPATVDFPSTAVTMTPLALLNWSGTTGLHYIQDFRIEEVTPSTLIANGAITTDKINANAVTAAKIAAGTITATQIASGTITADRMSVTSLSSLSANLGTVTINTTGSLSSGATAYGTGTGYWLAYNGGNPQFRIGNPSGSQMRWTGSSLEVFGEGWELSDDAGLAFETAGSDGDLERAVSWAGGSRIFERSGVGALSLIGTGNARINIYSADVCMFADSSSSVCVDGDSFSVFNGPLSLGTSGNRWSAVYGDSLYSGDLDGLGTVPVCADNSGRLVAC